eukprot:1611647-Amphidinium_carterae.1
MMTAWLRCTMLSEWNQGPSPINVLIASSMEAKPMASDTSWHVHPNLFGMWLQEKGWTTDCHAPSGENTKQPSASACASVRYDT